MSGLDPKPTLDRHAKTVAALVVWSGLVWADSFMFPIPADAQSPHHVVVGPGAEQDFFRLKATYPATPALAHYKKIFADWTECKPWAEGWEGYADSATGDERCVHRFTRNWISRNNKRAVTVLFQYESREAANKKIPDNDRQSVAVLSYGVQDAAGFFAQIRVICPQ